MTEIVLALDVHQETSAERVLDRMPDLRWVKVGPVLFTALGPAFIHRLVARGLQVFLDCKWHDIPHTVASAVEAAADLGVGMVTVHTVGGRAMVEAAVEAAGASLAVVGVTVLTSHDPGSWGEAVGRPAPDLVSEVVRLGVLAKDWGLRGIVCSPHEARAARSALGPEAWIVVPGVRRRGDARGDQRRVAGPREVVAAGATHLVVGRPILESEFPGQTYREFVDEVR